MSYACPECGGTTLKVCVRVWADLRQDEDQGFETDIDGGDHEWDGDSTMICASGDCTHFGDAKGFEVAGAPARG